MSKLLYFFFNSCIALKTLLRSNNSQYEIVGLLQNGNELRTTQRDSNYYFASSFSGPQSLLLDAKTILCSREWFITKCVSSWVSLLLSVWSPESWHGGWMTGSSVGLTRGWHLSLWPGDNTQWLWWKMLSRAKRLSTEHGSRITIRAGAGSSH